jgi:hypothetical protein
MTLGEELSTIRNNIKEVSDKSRVTDSFLYSLWKKARGRILGDRTNISRWNWKRFCIELEQAKSHNCECVAVGCDILKSVYPVPQPAINRQKDIIEVQTLSGRLIGIAEEYELMSERHDDVKSAVMRASFYNNHLIIWNNLNLKAVQVYAPWDDILAWQDIQYCTDELPCIDVLQTDTGLSERESEAVLRLTLDLLKHVITIQDEDEIKV